jgi:hypothetical protein
MANQKSICHSWGEWLKTKAVKEPKEASRQLAASGGENWLEPNLTYFANTNMRRELRLRLTASADGVQVCLLTLGQGAAINGADASIRRRWMLGCRNCGRLAAVRPR